MNKKSANTHSEDPKSALPKLTHIPTVGFAIAFLLCLAIVFFLFLGRTVEAVRIDTLNQVFTEFYQHVSNFALSICCSRLLDFYGYNLIFSSGT